MQEPMQLPAQEPKPRKTIHIGYLIAPVIVIIAAVVLAIVFWPSDESEAPAPTPTPPATATTAPTPTATQVSQVSVSITAPATVVKSAGRDFHVFVNISSVSNLAGAQYDIQYDPNVITYISATDGYVNGIKLPIQSKGLFPTSKKGVVRIIQLDTSLAGINGQGYLVDILFRVNGDAGDTSALTFIIPTDTNGQRALADVNAAEIPATWSDASVTIQ